MAAHFPGKIFASLREGRGFTQAGLADAMKPVKCRGQTISDFESGRTIRLRPDRWNRIAEVFGISVGKLDLLVYVPLVEITADMLRNPSGFEAIRKRGRSKRAHERSAQLLTVLRSGPVSFSGATIQEIDAVILDLIRERHDRGFPLLPDRLLKAYKSLRDAVEHQRAGRRPKPAGPFPLLDDD